MAASNIQMMRWWWALFHVAGLLTAISHVHYPHTHQPHHLLWLHVHINLCIWLWLQSISTSQNGCSLLTLEARKHAFDELEPAPIVYSSPLTAPLFLCFNWNDVFEKHGFTESSNFYVMAFRSVRKKDTDEETINRINNVALEEARKSGGLIRYWAGRANAQRQCLEASVWESKAAADRAARMPAYADAMRVAANLYESYTLERYSITATVDHLPAFKLIDTTSRY